METVRRLYDRNNVYAHPLPPPPKTGWVCKKYMLMLNNGGTCIEALRNRVRKRKPYKRSAQIRVVHL